MNKENIENQGLLLRHLIHAGLSCCSLFDAARGSTQQHAAPATNL